MSADFKNVFKQIFIEHWIEFQNKYPKYDTEYYDKVVEKMLECGDPEKGFVSYRCQKCGDTKKVPFSCKSSFCLSCAKIYTDRWVEYISKKLFMGMRYRHIVLTVPEILRKWFYRKPDLMSEFMKKGHEFYGEVVSYWLKETVEVGSAVVLQTGGRSGEYNPHLHIIGTSGGMTEERKWKGFGYIDYDLFHKKWQYSLLNMLREKDKNKEMEKDIQECWKKYPNGFVSYIERGEVPAGGKGLARYIAKYVVSPPIALRRIIKYDGKKVRYWYREHSTQKRKEEEVDVLTFIGRMVQHIQPKGFQRIRYYGLHAVCKVEKMREEIEEKLKKANGKESKEIDKETYQVTGYRDRIKKSFGVDPFICGKCGNEMELEGIWHPEYGWIVDKRDNFLEEAG